jgi:hypothetical protein
MVCEIIDKTMVCLPSLTLCHRFGTKVPFPCAKTTWLPTILLPAVKILLLDAFVTERSLLPLRLGIKDTISNCSNGLLNLCSLFICVLFFSLDTGSLPSFDEAKVHAGFGGRVLALRPDRPHGSSWSRGQAFSNSPGSDFFVFFSGSQASLIGSTKV